MPQSLEAAINFLSYFDQRIWIQGFDKQKRMCFEIIDFLHFDFSRASRLKL
jgi:hypothetical protein